MQTLLCLLLDCEQRGRASCVHRQKLNKASFGWNCIPFESPSRSLALKGWEMGKLHFVVTVGCCLICRVETHVRSGGKSAFKAVSCFKGRQQINFLKNIFSYSSKNLEHNRLQKCTYYQILSYPEEESKHYKIHTFVEPSSIFD